MPPILCGDFSAPPTSDEIRFLTATPLINGRSTYFQTPALIHDRGGVTWDPANDLAARFNEPPQRIDYVFVGDPYLHRDGAGRLLSASLVSYEPRTGHSPASLRALRGHPVAHAAASMGLGVGVRLTCLRLAHQSERVATKRRHRKSPTRTVRCRNYRRSRTLCLGVLGSKDRMVCNVRWVSLRDSERPLAVVCGSAISVER